MNKRRILITGCAGMIGSVLSRYFLDNDYEVFGIDNLSGGLRSNLDERVKFWLVDITNQKEVNTVFASVQPDYVIHLAAYAAEVLSPFIRNFNYTNNVIGSINIINACINNDIEKIVNFSSIATYGEGKPPFKETDIRQPKDCYGIAKLAVEMDLAEAYEHFGLKYSSVLPHNCISEYQNFYDMYRNAAAIFIRKAICGEKISVYGDGSQIRCFTDCQFLCEPIEKLLTAHDGELFNLGSEAPTTVLELAQLVQMAAAEFEMYPEIEFLEARREVHTVVSDHTKAKTLLNFKDATNRGEMIYKMFQKALVSPKQNIVKMNYEVTKNMYSYWK